MFRISLTSLLLVACVTLSSQAADKGGNTYRIPYDQLRAAATEYLTATCTQEAIRELDKKLARRVAQKVEDNDYLQEDSAMRTIMIDWAASNQKKIQAKKRKQVVQACHYLVRFVDKKFLMPWQFREQMTKKVCEELMTYLREEAAKAKKGNGKSSDKGKDGKK